MKRRLVPYFAVSVLFCMAASFAHPVTPTMFKALGFGDYLFGYSLAATLGTSFLVAPFWGKIGGYLSNRVLLLVGSLGYALGQFLFAVSVTEGQVLMARAFSGILSEGAFVALLNYVVNIAPDERTRGTYLTVTATVNSVAGAFGYFVGGILGEFSVAHALTAQVITLALCGVLFFLVCESDIQHPLSELKLREVARASHPLKAFMDAGKFMRGLFAVVCITVTLQQVGQTAFDQSFNYYLRDVFDFSSGYNGVLKAAMGIITLVANSTLCIYLIRRTDVRRSLIFVFALCTATMCGIVFTNSVVVFLLLNVVFYAFSSISIPLLQNLVAGGAGDGDSNLLMGFYAAMKNLGGIIGALIAGTLYAMGSKFPFVACIFAYGVSLMLAWTYYRGERASQRGGMK